MTVKAIRLENFMAFADTGWIELRPITLLFGRNSSGKSAIFRALRLLRQNLDKPGDYTLQFTSEFGVDLGGYAETVHGKDVNNLMRFHFRCSVPETSDRARQEINQWREQNDLPAIVASKDDTLSLTLTFGYDPHREAELIGIDLSCNWQISAENDSLTLLSALWLDQETRYEVGYDWRLDTNLPSWLEEDWRRTTFEFPTCFLPKIVDAPVAVLDSIFGALAESITTFLKGIEYIGPIRPEPQRVYLLDEIGRQRWRNFEYSAFLDFLEGNKLDEPLEKRIDKRLQTMDLAERIEPPAQYSDIDATVSKVIIQEKETKLFVNLKNTGFGASQVIPILVQSVTARQRVEEKKFVSVVVEQPELHLHPRAQAQLADMFVDEIYSFPDPLPDDFDLGQYLENQEHLSQVSFVLETHSENLLLRLRRRIAETSAKKQSRVCGFEGYLANEEVNLYFVHRLHDEGFSEVTRIPLTDFGDFKIKPDGFAGFFSNDLQELKAITSARLDALDSGME